MQERKGMAFRPISAEAMRKISVITGEAHLRVDEATLRTHAHDETEDLFFLPEAVVFPANTAEVSALMRLCHAELIPVTVRGGGSGLAGGALPVCGGLVLSMQRFDRILQIDARNFQVTVEPGVVTEVLQNALKAQGLFYPPDPSSRG